MPYIKALISKFFGRVLLVAESSCDSLAMRWFAHGEDCGPSIFSYPQLYACTLILLFVVLQYDTIRLVFSASFTSSVRCKHQPVQPVTGAAFAAITTYLMPAFCSCDLRGRLPFLALITDC